MNKYLNFHNKISELAHEELDEPSFEGLTKSIIASELNYILDWEDYADLKLSDKQQEDLISVIYDVYMDVDFDLSYYNATRAIVKILSNYDNFEDFYNYYEDNYYSFRDDFSFNIL